MRDAPFFKLCGASALFGGLGILLARLLEVVLFPGQPLSVQAADPNFLLALGIPGLVGSFGYMLGLVGLYVFQRKEAGVLGLIAFTLAFVGVGLSMAANWGYAFVGPHLARVDPGLLDLGFADPGWGVLGQAFSVSYLAGGAGVLILGISTLAAGALPRWVGWVMVGSIVLSVVLPFSVHSLAGVLVNLTLAAAPLAIGIALWQRAEK